MPEAALGQGRAEPGQLPVLRPGPEHTAWQPPRQCSQALHKHQPSAAAGLQNPLSGVLASVLTHSLLAPDFEGLLPRLGCHKAQVCPAR